MLIELPWKNQKPQYGTPINRRHPLAQGLVGAWLLNEGAGPNAFELVGLPAGAVGSACTRVASPYGGCLNFDGTSSSYIDLGSNAALRPTGSMTLVGIGELFHGAGTSYPLFSNSGNSGALGYQLFNQSINGTQDKWNFSIASSSTVAVTISGNAYTGSNGGFFAVAGVYNSIAQTMALYVNGAVEALADSSGGVPSSQFNQIIGNPKIGNYGQFLTSAYKGRIVYGLLFNRALSAGEVQQLSADPYCFMQPRRVWVPEPSAVVASQVWPYLEHSLNGGLVSMGL